MKKLLYIVGLVTLLTTLGFCDYYKESLTLDPDSLNQELSPNTQEDYVENSLFIYGGVGVTYVTTQSTLSSEKLARQINCSDIKLLFHYVLL